MRLIVPLILIALMLPYATGEDAPTPPGEWDIEPMPQLVAAAGRVDPDDAPSATQPATQPACPRGMGASPMHSRRPAAPPPAE